jgi:transcriptional regulator with XRE-family HTH domain
VSTSSTQRTHDIRRLREEAGLTRSEVGRLLEWSPLKVSRIETGQSHAQTGDVRDRLEIYGSTDPATIDNTVARNGLG